MNNENIYVDDSPISGRGVFANRNFELGEIIEFCPMLILPEKDVTSIDETELWNYYFLWGEKEIAIALGYGSLYNHSEQNNAEQEMYFEEKIMAIKAKTHITQGDEILIDYGPYTKRDSKFDIKI